MILAGDIGGTKTTLGLFSLAQGRVVLISEETFKSSEYTSLEKMAQDFLSMEKTGPLEAACFGVAGPVKAGSANITNLKWFIEENHLAAALGIRKIRLINDLAALASSLPLLTSSDLETLNQGVMEQKGVRAIIAPGTGLGEGFLTWDEEHWHSHPTEGGHTDFAPLDEEQIELLHYLEERNDHVSYELVCSGIGIPHLFNYLKDSGKYEVPAVLQEAIRTGIDLTPVIAGMALESGDPCPICSDTLRLFISILAAEAGNLALKVLPTGGMYIGGGLPLHILPLIKNSSFMETFTRKGRMSRIVADIPVHVILNKKAPLIGAAHEGLLLLKAGRPGT
jgi:glucokinase